MSGSFAVREFRYWMTNYRRTWRGSIYSSVLSPLLYLGAMGLGLGTLVDKHGLSSLGGVTYLAGWVVPESAVAATPTSGGIIKPRTNQLLTAPALTSQDISAGQVVVSGLGTFKLTHCQSGTC